MKRSSCVAMALASMLVAAQAHADEAAARTAIEEQRYDDARTLVKDDLASPVGARRVPALEIAAVSLLLEGKPAEAQPYVHALYELAPAFVLADESLPPRVTDAFAAEAGRPHARAIALSFRAMEDASFVIEASAPTHLAVSCRQNRADFSPVALAGLAPTRLGFRLPATAANACYALAQDDDGLPVGRLGSRDAPIVLKPEPRRASPTVLSRWWLWTSVGAAIAGGVVLAYAETRPDNRTLPAADVTAAGHKP